jgi:hypothetical protein
LGERDVKALIIGVLALTSALAVGGCSRQPPPQLAASCVDLAGHPCADSSVSQPMSLVPPRRRVMSSRSASAGRVARHSRAKRIEAARTGPQVRHAGTRTASAAPAATISSVPPPAPAPAAASSNEPRSGGKSETAKVQEQATVAATLAERMTAMGAAVRAVDKDKPDGRLVAVVMARPSVKALPDLSGKMIAIDERYAGSNGRITVAMTAAGAPDVLLLEGKSTAINRLSDGEVMAAVVALASPDAADAFPQLAGFNVFRVPLPATQ